MWMWTALWMQTVAQAGSGPWVIGEGQGSVYIGAEAQRLTKLAIVVDGERSVIPVGEGLSSLAVKGIAAVGLTRRFELQASVPYWRVQANRPDAQLCVDLGLGACRTTSTLGIIELRGKGLLVDEFFGGPFSFALGTEVRVGDFTAATRERITNVGEGGLDTGVFVSMGRTGAVGSEGYWSGYLELLARYRFPLTRSFPDNLGTPVPGSEFTGTAEFLVGPARRVAFGPIATSQWRPFGVDWGDTVLTDVDRLGALRVFNARVGGTIVIRGPFDLAASATVLQTVVAVNNPTDVLSVSAGLQTLIGKRNRNDG
ncbi:MAG: hypothetical protein KTR31_36475 [Myxococcales bacterium]|nr:hypothetical protein [Myxococcales bacterium]